MLEPKVKIFGVVDYRFFFWILLKYLHNNLSLQNIFCSVLESQSTYMNISYLNKK